MKRTLMATAVALACLGPVAQNANAGTATTVHPIVLVHGIFGFNNFYGAPYFYGISDTLTSNGATVYTATVAAAGSNETRGYQLWQYLKQIRNARNNQSLKFNLIGHSQGSPTARWVAQYDPGMVASVTSVDGVNKGSRVADIVRRAAPAGTYTEAVIGTVANAFTAMYVLATGNSSMPQSTIDALNSLTTAGLTAFNSRNPGGVPSGCGEGAYSANIRGYNVKYYSWGGAKQLTNVLDPFDAGIGVLSLAFVGSGEANDGLVSTCSQRLGKVIRADYKMNHLDAVNGWFGFVAPSWVEPTNPKTVYLTHANRLKNAGL
ncbi:MAG: triacylglycerol lipase [Rhodoferax sp.]|jgi:triacylglycerol lipase|nr:triacylglycerol lipase [Rhodoferax sp.]MBP9059379.1 triacylglycerol lipase [Rhodoferax sp.]MBP9683246.1 triacylglycerol lipase [Rhodoferax sp.]